MVEVVPDSFVETVDPVDIEGAAEVSTAGVNEELVDPDDEADQFQHVTKLKGKKSKRKLLKELLGQSIQSGGGGANRKKKEGAQAKGRQSRSENGNSKVSISSLSVSDQGIINRNKIICEEASKVFEVADLVGLKFGNNKDVWLNRVREYEECDWDKGDDRSAEF
ncbi:hypothetical protein L1049_011509 [Liquidambar formosana]|uniref:Uncharacterized protein n=1 Tax=Liquidambar formosana TaxID=63359 RepID=A0AAP0RS77_LIQFO